MTRHNKFRNVNFDNEDSILRYNDSIQDVEFPDEYNDSFDKIIDAEMKRNNYKPQNTIRKHEDKLAPQFTQMKLESQREETSSYEQVSKDQHDPCIQGLEKSKELEKILRYPNEKEKTESGLTHVVISTFLFALIGVGVADLTINKNHRDYLQNAFYSLTQNYTKNSRETNQLEK